jgi:hypothetical protein
MGKIEDAERQIAKTQIFSMMIAGEIIRLASLHYLTGKLCIAAPARAQRQPAPRAGA